MGGLYASAAARGTDGTMGDERTGYCGGDFIRQALALEEPLSKLFAPWLLLLLLSMMYKLAGRAMCQPDRLGGRL